ncbi:uncharacterized protein LOC111460634 [Cucurbita moschata]|uniref:Uncharacterized protein LOC111460634 n=1 Tax=Cucurbita moschata TaxID=3662 RepID=A0A6J1H8K3_CUCMO|nr:uncharacterized protein LOC111460634 [Cucurbita moschata]
MFEEEWKSLFPIGTVFKSPLLLSGSSAKDSIGPVVFNPISTSLTRLFSSRSFLPSLSPPSILNLYRFLHTSSSVVPSTSSTVVSLFGEQHNNDAASTLRYNRLQLLRCPNSNSVVVFFPTGPNSDRVGFLVVSGNCSGLSVQSDCDNDVFSVESELKYQILGISVNPVSDLRFDGDSFIDIGFLLAYTMYSVEWFIVKSYATDSSFLPKVSLVHLGSKVFKSCSVVHACWSPHLSEESVVLLEDGSLFLFDMEPLLKAKTCSTYANLKGIRLRVSWDTFDCSKKVKWLSCEFSWHPRILIVARSDAVLLVDLREDESSISCLVKIDLFHSYSLAQREQFLAFSKAGSDGFFFTVASNSLLILCDIRKPMSPVLQWTHCLDEPSYMNVFSLSKLRSSASNGLYRSASESGYCIILGSFWSCEFNIFCYGPSPPTLYQSVSSRSSKYFQPLYAWERPSNLILSGRECSCGSCLVRQETFKDAIPEWVEWQQKKEIVLGFGILDTDISPQLAGQNEHGGFTLLRLVSSGALESQTYQASWNSLKRIDESHKESLNLADYFLYGWLVDDKYRFSRKFMYFSFEYLMGYLNDNLDEVLDSFTRKYSKDSLCERALTSEIHAVLCEKLKACGFDRLRSSPALAVVFNDISLPASIQEIAFKKLWASLPMELLHFAFSNYSEFLEDKNPVSLEFSTVPSLHQLPPFMLRNQSSRSNKWSEKVHRTESLVGPVLPLPILLVLHEFQNGCSKLEEEAGKFSLKSELSEQYDQIRFAAREMAVSPLDSKVDDGPIVSLSDDQEYVPSDSQKPKNFVSYHPSAFDSHTSSNTQGNSTDHAADVFDTLIFKLEEKSKNEELFDGLCPVGLKFDVRPMNFRPNELKAYGLLKKQLLKWGDGFAAYKEFRSKI